MNAQHKELSDINAVDCLACAHICEMVCRQPGCSEQVRVVQLQPHVVSHNSWHLWQ